MNQETLDIPIMELDRNDIDQTGIAEKIWTGKGHITTFVRQKSFGTT